MVLLLLLFVLFIFFCLSEEGESWVEWTETKEPIFDRLHILLSLFVLPTGQQHGMNSDLDLFLFFFAVGRPLGLRVVTQPHGPNSLFTLLENSSLLGLFICVCFDCIVVVHAKADSTSALFSFFSRIHSVSIDTLARLNQPLTHPSAFDGHFELLPVVGREGKGVEGSMSWREGTVGEDGQKR